MYNVVSKLVIGSLLLTGTFSLSSCGDNTSEQDAAKALLNSADSAYKAQNYILSQQLIDSLQSKYPKQINIQRDALHLRPKVIESATIKEIENCDSTIAVLMQKKELLDAQFIYIDNPQLVEGYYVTKGNTTSNLFGRTGIEARITPNGDFYLLSSLTARQIKHTSVSLVSGKNTAKTTDIAYDGDRNYRSSGTEMITFVGEECDTLGHFASINKENPIVLVFNGNGNYKQNLSKKEVLAIANTYEMSQTMLKLSAMKRKKELLDQQLMLARNQIARTMKDSVNKE